MAARRASTGNAIKAMGTSKAKTRQIADQARPGDRRKPVAKTATRQGGSPKGGRAPDTPHPSQRGGVPPDAHGDDARHGAASPRKRSGEKTPGTGLIKGPSRGRLKTPAAVGGRTRVGRDQRGQNRRGKARQGSRTRGRG